MLLLTISYYSQKWGKYMILHQRVINRAIKNAITRNANKEKREEGFYRTMIFQEDRTTVFFTREKVKMVQSVNELTTA